MSLENLCEMMFYCKDDGILEVTAVVVSELRTIMAEEYIGARICARDKNTMVAPSAYCPWLGRG